MAANSGTYYDEYTQSIHIFYQCRIVEYELTTPCSERHLNHTLTIL